MQEVAQLLLGERGQTKRASSTLAALVERMGTGLPLAISEIDRMILASAPAVEHEAQVSPDAGQPALPACCPAMQAAQLASHAPFPCSTVNVARGCVRPQVLRRMRRICEEQHARLERFWVDPALLQVHELLGQGSGGQVFRGRFKHRQVAVKLLPLPPGAWPAGAAAGDQQLAWLLESCCAPAAALRRELSLLSRSHEFEHACRWPSRGSTTLFESRLLCASTCTLWRSAAATPLLHVVLPGAHTRED
jgi:hypothetical protein